MHPPPPPLLARSHDGRGGELWRGRGSLARDDDAWEIGKKREKRKELPSAFGYEGITIYPPLLLPLAPSNSHACTRSLCAAQADPDEHPLASLFSFAATE